MITREEALEILEEKVQNKNIIKHMLATEAMMIALAQKLDPEEEEEWGVAGLLHDGDYSEGVPVEKQGMQISEWIKEKGYDIPESVQHAMAAHNMANTGVKPESKMDWALFCGDSLTGLIIACALVLPDKKLADVKVESVLKKFDNPSFAGGTRREEIKMCEERLGISLEEFVKITLEAMQTVHERLGL